MIFMFWSGFRTKMSLRVLVKLRYIRSCSFRRKFFDMRKTWVTLVYPILRWFIVVSFFRCKFSQLLVAFLNQFSLGVWLFHIVCNFLFNMGFRGVFEVRWFLCEKVNCVWVSVSDETSILAYYSRFRCPLYRCVLGSI